MQSCFVCETDDFREKSRVKTCLFRIALAALTLARIIQKHFDKIRLAFEQKRPLPRNLPGVVNNQYRFAIKIAVSPLFGKNPHLLKLPNYLQRMPATSSEALQRGNKINACGAI